MFVCVIGQGQSTSYCHNIPIYTIDSAIVDKIATVQHWNFNVVNIWHSVIHHLFLAMQNTAGVDAIFPKIETVHRVTYFLSNSITAARN